MGLYFNKGEVCFYYYVEFFKITYYLRLLVD